MDLSILNSGKIAETTYLTDEMFRRQDSTNRSYGFSREMGYYKASITGLNMMVGQGEWLLMNRNVIHGEEATGDVCLLQIHIPQADMGIILEQMKPSEELAAFFAEETPGRNTANME